MKFKQRLLLIPLICLIGVFLFSVSMLIRYYTQGTKEENAFRDLAEAVKDSSAATIPQDHISPEAPVSEVQDSGLLAQYQALNKQNPDMAGWIRIDGTAVDYPVMYSPDDGDFYLNHGFGREKAKSGVPFIDERCAIDPLGINTIIYGHHMKNGTMFAALKNYREQDYYTEHPTIRFDTLNARQEYQIVAVFESRVYQKSDDAFKFYNFPNINGEDAFDEYIENIKALSLYDTGVTASYGDELITLVTCDYQTENGRLVVVAKKK